MGNGDWGLETGDWGLGLAAYRHPLSAGRHGTGRQSYGPEPPCPNPLRPLEGNAIKPRPFLIQGANCASDMAIE